MGYTTDTYMKSMAKSLDKIGKELTALNAILKASRFSDSDLNRKIAEEIEKALGSDDNNKIETVECPYCKATVPKDSLLKYFGGSNAAFMTVCPECGGNIYDQN